jgi:predicted small metal-binding protein
MAKDADPKKRQDSGATNTNFASHVDGINPSAPASGTAGWGTAPDEREVLDSDNSAATRAGQMKGNPGDNMTEASNRASEAASTNKKPEERGENPTDHSTRIQTIASSGASRSHSVRAIRCADVGNADCNWEASGEDEEELLERAAEHGRTQHGWADWTEAMRTKAREAIARNQAA